MVLALDQEMKKDGISAALEDVNQLLLPLLRDHLAQVPLGATSLCLAKAGIRNMTKMSFTFTAWHDIFKEHSSFYFPAASTIVYGFSSPGVQFLSSSGQHFV